MFGKTLTLASLNVRGLGINSPKQKAIKLWLASLPSPPPNPSHPGISPGSRRHEECWEKNRVLEGGSFWNPGIPMGPSQRMSASIAILVDRMTALLVEF